MTTTLSSDLCAVLTKFEGGPAVRLLEPPPPGAAEDRIGREGEGDVFGLPSLTLLPRLSQLGSMSDADSSYPRPYNGLSPAPRNFSLTLDAPLVLRLSLSNSKVNQWSDLMTYDFHRILSHISVDPDVAVVILTGEGERAFCAGLDVTSGGLVELIEDDPARSAWKLKRHIDEFQASLTMLEGCGKPVIAAVHGVAYGLGVDLMSACDIRYADQGARFSIREVVSSEGDVEGHSHVDELTLSVFTSTSA